MPRKIAAGAVLVGQGQLLATKRDHGVLQAVLPRLVGERGLAKPVVQSVLGDAKDGGDLILGAEQLGELRDGAQHLLVGLQDGPAGLHGLGEDLVEEALLLGCGGGSGCLGRLAGSLLSV